MTWNATGIMTGIPYLLEQLVTRQISICGISEHWLLEHSSYLLDSVDPNYKSHVTICEHPKIINNRRIGKGGVAFLWHKSLHNMIEILDIGSDRLTAMKVSLSDQTLVILQVYLPCSNHKIDLFKDEVDKLNDICDSYGPQSKLVIMGDFNGTFLRNSTSY